jgi:hypothetical protein
MNTRLLNRAVLATVTALLCFPIVSYAVVNTQLLSQDFSGATFPPSGWSANQVQSQGSYTFGSGYWYHSNYGNGGANGSAVAWVYYGYTQYGNTSTEVTLTTAPVDASGYTSDADSTFVDFDLWAPANYYDYYYDKNSSFNVKANATTISTTNAPGMWTFQSYSNYYGFSDPGSYGYYSSSYWKHYHVYIPKANRTSNMTITLDAIIKANCCVYYTYANNIAVDNVVISNNHYDFIGVNTAFLNFGDEPVADTSAPLYVELQNQSERTINVGNFSIGGANPNDFIIVRSPSSIAPGSTDSIGVVFNPTAKGNRGGTLGFTTDADNLKNITISLRGFGLVPVIGLPSNLVLFSRTSGRFADTISQSFAVTNVGQVPLIISPATYIGGDHPEQYTIIKLPTAPILPNSSDTVTVAFQPTNEGLASAILYIASNADNGTQQIPLKGIGILARLTVDDAYANNINVNFDSVNVGTTICQNVTLYNPGSDTLIIARNFISRSDYDFVITPLTGSDTLIAPEQSKQINVCFTPLRNGYRTASITLTTSIPLTYETPRRDTSQFTINLFGTGVPFGHIALSAASLVDTTIVGTQICTSTTLTNTGTTDVTLTAASFSGTSASAFVFSGATFPLTLAPGAMQVVTICGTPAVRGDNLATLSVTGTTNGQSINSTIPVDVVGLSVCASTTPTVAFNSNSCIGEGSDTAVITVTNCGDVATSYSAAITGAGASSYSILPTSTSSMVAVNSTATFQIVYTPTTPGTAAGTLTITAPDVPAMTVQLNGTGTQATIAGAGTAPVTDVGATSANFDVTVNNTGACDWTPGVPTVSSPFTYVGGGNTVIPAGGSGTLTFTFNPTAAGTFNQTLTFPNQIGSSSSTVVTLSGTTSSASVSEKTSQDGFTLGQSYPNPFHGQTQVTIGIPQESVVRMDIVNQAGEVVESVMNQRMGEGSYTVTIDASNLASGTYYYSLTSGNVRLTRQMVLVK